MVERKDQLRLRDVAFSQQLAATWRILPRMALVLMSLASPPMLSHAAQLDASTFLETGNFMTPYHLASASPVGNVTNTKLVFDSGFLEADIADFAVRRTQKVALKGVNPRPVEFSSFGIDNMSRSGAAPQTSDSRMSNSFRETGSAAAGMPFMVVISLFAIGLIGIGTVGRRKQSRP